MKKDKPKVLRQRLMFDNDIEYDVIMLSSGGTKTPYSSVYIDVSDIEDVIAEIREKLNLYKSE